MEKSSILKSYFDSLDKDMLLDDDELADYDYIRYDIMNPGVYYSKIVHAEKAVSRKNLECYDIFYKMVSREEYISWYNCETEKVKFYHIKQRYIKGSSASLKFSKAMRNAGLPSKAPINQAVGVTEKILIGFPDDNNMGSIVDRCYNYLDTTEYEDIFALDDGDIVTT